MAVGLLTAWLVLVVLVMSAYTIRHWIFTLSRVYGRQRSSFGDACDDDLPTLAVLVPMHDEARVAGKCLEAILAAEYPADRLEVLAIDDHSRDGTGEIVAEFAARDRRVRPLVLAGEERGKAQALNVALGYTKAEIVLVFDADYTPGRGLFRSLVSAFVDPRVGAVMGRVVPRNASRNLLTHLLAMERAGGYQVDQQARFNLRLLPQYGGTVGGFRRGVLEELGGFDPRALAEDTELTAKLYRRGWSIAYDNRAECYEEVPEAWSARFRQLRRWSRGHNRVLREHLWGLLRTPELSFAQRLDAAMLLGSYLVPPLVIGGWLAALALFLLGALPVYAGVALAFCVVLYNAFGNFAPVYQVATAEVLDGTSSRVLLLPYLFAMFPFNAWSVTEGFIDAIGDTLKNRHARWEKTARSEAQA